MPSRPRFSESVYFTFSRCRRHAERGRDIVESIDGDILRQDVGFDLDGKQVVHGRDIFGTV